MPRIHRAALAAALAAGLAQAPAMAAEAPPKAQGHWIYRLVASRPNLMATLTPAEVRLFGEHQAHLQGLREAKRLVLAGVCEDRAFGLVIFKATDEAAAKATMAADPAVRGGLLRGELHPFSEPMLP